MIDAVVKVGDAVPEGPEVIAHPLHVNHPAAPTPGPVSWWSACMYIYQPAARSCVPRPSQIYFIPDEDRLLIKRRRVYGKGVPEDHKASTRP